MIVNTLKLTEPGFPDSLKNISSPPAQIYWQGQKPDKWLSMPKVAVVGSRRLTPYGKTTTDRFVTELAQAGAVIISGLAYGIDITAHRAALAVDGLTVAVLPSSLDQIYPAIHANVAQQILKHGTLISEYAPESNIAYKSNFIARNRLISGLADVVLITEAAVNSGSLHTARFAMEQGKTVMAVPGNITSPTSEGCNNLIKSGALPTTDVADILFALKINPAKSRIARQFRGSSQEESIYSLIKQGVAGQEQLALTSKLDAQSLSNTLTMLEIAGYIRPLGAGNWTIA